MRKLVGLIPGQLLGEKTVATAFPDNLRQCRRIAEYIRQPEIFDFNAEFITEEIFPMQKLPDDRFAAC